MARILWSFVPQPGCWYPAAPIVQELVRRGHLVVAHSWPAGEVVARGLSLPFVAELPRAAAGPPVDLESALELRIRATRAAMASAAGELATARYDAVLADAFRMGAGMAALRHGVPWVSYTHHFFGGGDLTDGLFDMWWTRFGGRGSKVAAYAAWWERLRSQVDVPAPDACLRWRGVSSRLTLVLGIPELFAADGPAPGFVRFAGPSCWAPPLAGPPPGWLPLLGAERPAVLVSQSTTELDDASLLACAVEALDGLDVVLTNRTEVRGPLPRSVRVAGALPHGLLLDRVSAVVCSAGHGTTACALRAGVPLALVPRAMDQFLLADAALAAGVARVVQPADLTPARLREAVDACLLPEVRRRAAEVAAGVAGCRTPASAADLILEALA